MEEGSTTVLLGEPVPEEKAKYIGADLLYRSVIKPIPGDPIVRKVIKHDANTLTNIIIQHLD